MYSQPNSHIDHGEHTAAIAFQIATQAGHVEYSRLSSAMCWDAMLRCAWLANGVNCTDLDFACRSGGCSFSIISSANYDRVFDAETQNITSVAQMLDTVMPGSFIGFVRPTNMLGHAMIYTRDGYGAGNKNDCVFASGSPYGWEIIDLRKFFEEDAAGNPGTRMIARAVECQVII